ncbi:MAG: hypothetical protein RL757_2141 [Bacteroidota bacterium]|jgi:hypothetical protein
MKSTFKKILFALILFNTTHAHTQNLAAFQLPLKLQREKKFDIPFQFRNNFIVIPITFEDDISLLFIFDTGAEHTTLLKKNIATNAKIKLERPIQLLGADLKTKIDAHIARRCRFQIGDIRFKRDILVLEKDYLEIEKNIGIPIDGILGVELFAGFQITINYLEQKITVAADQAIKPPVGKKWQKIPIEIIKNKPYIHLDLKNHAAQTPTNVKLLLDTGAALALLLAVTENSTLQIPEQTIRANLGAGLGGSIAGVVGRTPVVELANYALTQVPTHFQDLRARGDTVFFSNRDGIVGNEILSRFIVVLDFSTGFAYFKKNRRFYTDFIYDRSGLTIVASGKNLDHYTIFDVLPNSPASEIDLQPGDEILRVGMWSAKWFSLGSISDKLEGRVGEKIRLKIRRNQQILKKTITLRNLI